MAIFFEATSSLKRFFRLSLFLRTVFLLVRQNDQVFSTQLRKELEGEGPAESLMFLLLFIFSFLFVHILLAEPFNGVSRESDSRKRFSEWPNLFAAAVSFRAL